MVISIKPDPGHPRGGYAELTFTDSDAAEGAVPVTVFDNYSERYLGDAGWQATKVLFGPYTVERADGVARLVIGPEIVNQIEEYANVRLTVQDISQDISWPDDIVPAPGAAKIGGIMSASAKPSETTSALGATMLDPDPEPVGTSEAVADAAPALQPMLPPAKGGIGALVVGAVVVALGSAALAYWFVVLQDDPEPVSPAVSPAAVVSDPCSAASLGALDSFAIQAAALRECGAKATADAALGLVERAAALGDADALLLFGTVYDGAVSDDVIEDGIGLTFDDVPATAAEYYARAVTAGSDQAAQNLEALCARMMEMTDTLSRGAVSDHCGN